MVLVKHQDRLLLAFLQTSFVLVSSRPSYEASFSIYRTPSDQNFNFVNFLINGKPLANVRTLSSDDNVSAYIINGNGEYIPIPIQNYGNSISENNGDGNYVNIPIVYHDSYGAVTENPTSNTFTSEKNNNHGAADRGALVHKDIISLLNPVESIGQQEQKLRDYYAELLSNQLSRTSESSTVVPTSSTPTSVAVDQREHQLNQSPIVLSNQKSGPPNKPTISSTAAAVTATNAPEIYTTSEIPMKMVVHHDPTEEENKPASLDQQPNTLLFTDPLEESNEDEVSYLFDVDGRKIHPENQLKSVDFNIDERTLIPYSNAEKSGKATRSKFHGKITELNSTDEGSVIADERFLEAYSNTADSFKNVKRYTDSQATNVSEHHERHRKPHSTKPATAFNFVYDDTRLAPKLKKKLNMTTDIVEKGNQTAAISSIRVNYDPSNSTNNKNIDSEIVDLHRLFDKRNFKFMHATEATNVTDAEESFHKSSIDLSKQQHTNVTSQKETKSVINSPPGNVTSYQNVFSSFVDKLYTSSMKSDGAKLKPKEFHPLLPVPLIGSDVWKNVNQLMYGGTKTRKNSGRIPGREKDRITLWKAPSRNVAAQNEIISSIITKMLQLIVSPIDTRTSHRMASKNGQKNHAPHKPNFLKVQLQEVKFPE